MNWHTPLLLALLCLSGCAEVQPDGCVNSERSVSLEDATSVGSAQDLVALVEGTEQTTLTGPALHQVPLTVEVTWTGDEASWNDRGPSPSATEREGTLAAEAVCADTLAVPVDLRFQTEDGSFDELWVAQIQSTASGEASLIHEVPVDQLQGTWAPAADDYRQLRLQIEVRWTDEGSHGVLRVIGSRDDGGADETWDLAVWPAA